MNAPRKVTNATSTANQTSIFGSMPGLGPSIRAGTSQFTTIAIQRRGTTFMVCNPSSNVKLQTPAQQYSCLQQNNLIFRNKMTGGVGRKTLLIPRVV